MERSNKTKRTHAGVMERRSAGVLLHVTSLPGAHGIGDFGPEAFRFVDWLARARQTWWQILPLSPPGAGFSPYQSFSAFAGNTMLISPEVLLRDGLLNRSEIPKSGRSLSRVEFERVDEVKGLLLAHAWERFKTSANRKRHSAYRRFVHAERAWLDDFALFMALRESHRGTPWTDWPRDLVFRKPAALDEARINLADNMGRHQFGQFLFHQQLGALRQYAEQRGVKLLGDLPIFVSPESSDVWAHPNQFLLDRNRRPKAVAGVPPDYFSSTGQRWGNPLYDWKAMRQDRYRWWIGRVRATLAQVDFVRIDHFRGFEAHWEVPASAPTAQTGKWVKGPGSDFFEAVRKAIGSLPFVAEDLGVITPPVELLRDAFHLPGMRVLQFAFGGGFDNPFLPHNYVQNAVAYTGTHDNDTTLGWYRSLDKRHRDQVNQYLPAAAKDPAWAAIRATWSSVAKCAIAPAQDLMRLDSEGRMNLPGSATGNWGWRAKPDAFTKDLADELADLTETYGRSVKTEIQ